MKVVFLSQGQFAIVDDEDYERVSRFCWTARRIGHAWYAYRRAGGRNIHLHRFLLDAPDGFDVDHKNRNGLDNRKENLRICTRAQNLANRKVNARSRTGYKGVAISKNRFVARIGRGYKQIHLGSFPSAKEAAIAYDRAALERFGQFAWLNFPELA